MEAKQTQRYNHDQTVWTAFGYGNRFWTSKIIIIFRMQQTRFLKR